jgi:hypothetical protein
MLMLPPSCGCGVTIAVSVGGESTSPSVHFGHFDVCLTAPFEVQDAEGLGRPGWLEYRVNITSQLRAVAIGPAHGFGKYSIGANR